MQCGIIPGSPIAGQGVRILSMNGDRPDIARSWPNGHQRPQDECNLFWRFLRHLRASFSIRGPLYSPLPEQEEDPEKHRFRRSKISRLWRRFRRNLWQSRVGQWGAVQFPRLYEWWYPPSPDPVPYLGYYGQTRRNRLA